MRLPGCLLLATLFLGSTSFAHNSTANPEDVVSIDALINAYYESVSGHPGERDGERMLTLFIEGGKISIDLTGATPTHKLAKDYLATESFLVLSTDFFEREISRNTQRFGNLANVISTYGISDAMDNTDYTARGVTFFQLVKDQQRWWILSTAWQREDADNPLPGRLLDQDDSREQN